MKLIINNLEIKNFLGEVEKTYQSVKIEPFIGISSKGIVLTVKYIDEDTQEVITKSFPSEIYNMEFESTSKEFKKIGKKAIDSCLELMKEMLIEKFPKLDIELVKEEKI